MKRLALVVVAILMVATNPVFGQDFDLPSPPLEDPEWAPINSSAETGGFGYFADPEGPEHYSPSVGEDSRLQVVKTIVDGDLSFIHFVQAEERPIELPTSLTLEIYVPPFRFGHPVQDPTVDCSYRLTLDDLRGTHPLEELMRLNHPEPIEGWVTVEIDLVSLGIAGRVSDRWLFLWTLKDVQAPEGECWTMTEHTDIGQTFYSPEYFPVANEPLPELPADNDVDLRVYPNPVSAGTDVTVEFASDMFGIATIEVFDLLGREVIGSTEVSLAAVRRTSFDTGRLSPGTYIVRSRVDDKVLVSMFTVVR